MASEKRKADILQRVWARALLVVHLMNRPPDFPQPDCERDLTVNFKSPLKLRQDLEAARSRLELLIGVLEVNASEANLGVGEEPIASLENFF